MPALPLPKYGLDKLFLFPVYGTREEYQKATGQEAPPWDLSRPPKYWFDPAAAGNARRSIIYDNVIAYWPTGQPLRGPDGKPVLDSLLLSRAEAAAVNLPPFLANVPGTEVPQVPIPLRALDADEELDFDFGGIIVVRNKKFADQKEVGFTIQDREILRAIARKLNVPL